MIKKIALVIFLLGTCSSQILGQNAQQPQVQISPEVEQFFGDVLTHFLDPKWVSKEMLKFGPDDVGEVFVLITEFMTEKLCKWRYLYDHQDAFKDDFIDAKAFIEHFKEYHDFFDKTAINISSMRLREFNRKLYSPSEFESADGEVYLPLMVYLKTREPIKFNQFYANYFSYLSSCFIDLTKESYNTKNKALLPEIDSLFDQICVVATESLKGSEYESRAMQALMKYYGLYFELNRIFRLDIGGGL